MVYQSPYLNWDYPYPWHYWSYSYHLIPPDWPVPPDDLIMCYGRFKISTVPTLPNINWYTTIKCLTLDRRGHDYYIGPFPNMDNFWTFYVHPDFQYCFPIVPSTLLEFEVTISHPALLGDYYRVILQSIVL